MNYKLKFLPTALKEWKKLDNTIQTQLKKKLKELLKSPHLYDSQLRGFKNHYKIKLRASGYRLVYEVIDDEICVLVIAIGKRNKNEVYKHAQKRANQKKHKKKFKLSQAALASLFKICGTSPRRPSFHVERGSPTNLTREL